MWVALLFVLLWADCCCLESMKHPKDVEGVSWVDKHTGRRVTRLTPEDNSFSPHFNVNIFTVDGKGMIYTLENGDIYCVDLTSLKSRLIVGGGNITFVGVGTKTRAVYYTSSDIGLQEVLLSRDIDTLEWHRVVALPKYARAESINSDETMVAGAYVIGEEENVQKQSLEEGGKFASHSKALKNRARYRANLPMSLYVVNLQTGATIVVHNSTSWINHIVFSPTDPYTLMFSHEGAWHLVDRIWVVPVVGAREQARKKSGFPIPVGLQSAEPLLVHNRTMPMEIAGHEFWGRDGSSIWYDLQVPKGKNFFLAGYHLNDARRTVYSLMKDEFSIHYNVSPDGRFFCGDGSDHGHVARAENAKWIYLFSPQRPNLTHDGVHRAELQHIKLVNMQHQNYSLEPNTRFTPDGRMIVFRGNMFGQAHLYAVTV